ncbi:MAG: trypsin-like peptidase domain-containing protein [Kiritimatiellae bacterium]|nr:trypsin-like peptidase domain-containing protein [Kiritimatiellia bacterium]
MKRALLLFVYALGLAGAAGADPVSFERSVVRVIVHHQRYSPYRPWEKTAPGVGHGYGVAIGASAVITTEDLVRSFTMVELQRSKSGKKTPAAVEQVDYQGDMALLRLGEPDAAQRCAPLELAADVGKDDAVQIVQFDETDDIQCGGGQIVKVSVERLPGPGRSSLTFSVLTDLNVHGRGAAVVADGRLVGLVVRYDKSTRMAQVLPYPVLRHFLDDVADPPYRGFALAGFAWSALVDPVKRTFLRAPAEAGGVEIVATLPDTGAESVLRPGDVIVEWDGHAIDDMGYYADAAFGRLLVPHLIKGEHYPGDVVPVRVYRDGMATNVEVRLTSRPDDASLIPDNVACARADYLVEGGLVIRELSADHIGEYGDNWRLRFPRLGFLYDTRAERPEQPGDRIVLLSHVLPDPINIGYQHLREGIITHVNGEAIRHIGDVFRIVDRDDGVERVRIEGLDVELVLDKRDLPAANRSVSETYSIPELRYRNRTDTEASEAEPGP